MGSSTQPGQVELRGAEERHQAFQAIEYLVSPLVPGGELPASTVELGGELSPLELQRG